MTTITLPEFKVFPDEVRTAVEGFQCKYDHQMRFSPDVCFEKENKVLSISGVSTSLFSRATFTVITDKIRTYLQSQEELKIRIDLDSVNTSTVKGLLDLFLMLNVHHEKGKKISVEWITNDDGDLLEIAIDMNYYCQFPMVYVVK